MLCFRTMMLGGLREDQATASDKVRRMETRDPDAVCSGSTAPSLVPDRAHRDPRIVRKASDTSRHPVAKYSGRLSCRGTCPLIIRAFSAPSVAHAAAVSSDALGCVPLAATMRLDASAVSIKAEQVSMACRRVVRDPQARAHRHGFPAHG